MDTKETKGKNWLLYLKRVGLAGFLFFFAKGMVWLVVIYVLGAQVSC